MIKNIILDTNVLLTDPLSIFRFQENTIVIPTTVLHELDNIKDRKDKAAVSSEAREAIRIIDSILGEAKPSEISAGVKIKYPEGMQNLGGTLTVASTGDKIVKEIMSELDIDDSPDSKIIALALHYQREQGNATLVTRDVNMRLIASSYGVNNVEGYKNEKALEDLDLLTSGKAIIKSSGWNDLVYDVTVDGVGNQVLKVSKELIDEPYAGLHVIFDDADGTYLGVLQSVEDGFVHIERKDHEAILNQKAWGIKPRNKDQAIALDMLLDEQVDVAVLFGPAGTGKTLLSIAAAIELTIERKQYSRVICTRAVADLEAPIGFIPGTEQEKMSPWMAGFTDALELIHSMDEKGDTKGTKYSSADYTTEKANIQFKSINFFRGSSWNDCICIIDEVQNLSRYQVKSIVSRAGKNCKLILLGNLQQIDSGGSALESGLTHLVVKSKHYKGARTLHLNSIERSPLAEFAENYL